MDQHISEIDNETDRLLNEITMSNKQQMNTIMNMIPIRPSVQLKYNPTEIGHYNTNAYGEIKFPGAHSKKAKYIKVSSEVKSTDLVQYLYSNEGLKLKKPKLILSIAGGAKKLAVSSSWKKEFKSGIIKAAKSANAWITTGGINVGIMRLIGDALSEEINTDNIAVLGFATWGTIANRNILIRPENENPKVPHTARYYPTNIDKIDAKSEVSLNPQHTHFIFYDDNSQLEFGKETLLRANVEHEISKGKSLKDYQRKGPEQTKKEFRAIPTVLLVIRGGRNTLRLIHLYRRKIPFVVFLGTKGCADLINEAFKLSNEDKENTIEIGNLIDAHGILDYYKDQGSYKLERDLAVKRLIEILKYPTRFSFCALNKDSDMKTAILDALFKEQTNLAQNFKLEMLWNRYQISRTESLQEKFESLKPKDLEALLEMALLENNSAFTNALLERGINLDLFLTLERFDKFYNSKRNSKNKEPFSLYMEKTNNNFHENTQITSECLKRFFRKHIFEKFDTYFLPENLDKDNGKTIVKHSEQNLFIWCILFNQVEIAMQFWAIGEHQISNALLASKIFRLFARYLTDLSSELIEKAHQFENLAIGVMNVFDDNTRDSMNSKLLLTKIPFLNKDCLEFAVDCGCKQFVALPSVQNIITEMWYRELIHKAGTQFRLKFAICLLSLGFLAPFLIQKNKTANNDKLIKKEIYMGRHGTIPIFQSVEGHHEHTNLSLCSEAEETADEEVEEETDDESIVNESTIIRIDEEGKPNEESSNKNGGEKKVRMVSIDFNDSFEGKKQIKHQQSSDLTKRNMKKSNGLFNYGSCSEYFANYINFFRTPIVLFVYNTVAYVAFLCVFSVTMLSNFYYFDEIKILEKMKNNESNHNESIHNESIHDTGRSRFSIISPLEILLTIWVFSLLIEEFNQLYFRFDQSVNTIKQNLLNYFNDEWNILDALGCGLFFIGIILRLVSLWTTKAVFIWARITLGIDLSIWFIRSLYFCLAFRAAGPKLLMIRKMIADLKFFLIIIAIFMCAYSITAHSILFPFHSFDLTTLLRIINLGYWSIFGEIIILDDLSNKNCDSDPTKCFEPTSAFVCSIMLMIYMVISAVLLINMVIAMFNSTYEIVQENSDILWKFQRYELLSESNNFCYFPPPLNILYYISIKPLLYCIEKCQTSEPKVNENYLETIEESNEMVDEQKCAIKHLRDLKTMQRNTIDSKMDLQIEKLFAYEQKLNDMAVNRSDTIQKLEDLADFQNKTKEKLTNYEKIMKDVVDNQKRLNIILEAISKKANVKKIIVKTQVPGRATQTENTEPKEKEPEPLKTDESLAAIKDDLDLD